MIYEIEPGLKPRFERSMVDVPERRAYWARICHHLPMAFGTDCKSLYGVCNKTGSLPEERRVALDLLDVRESLEQFGDVIRLIPTDRRRVGSLTKNRSTYLLTNDLRDMIYSLKCDKEIKETTRAMATVRKALREKKADSELDTHKVYKTTTSVRHHLTHLTDKCEPCRVYHIDKWQQAVAIHGYSQACHHDANLYCTKE